MATNLDLTRVTHFSPPIPLDPFDFKEGAFVVLKSGTSSKQCRYYAKQELSILMEKLFSQRELKLDGKNYFAFRKSSEGIKLVFIGEGKTEAEKKVDAQRKRLLFEKYVANYIHAEQLRDGSFIIRCEEMANRLEPDRSSESCKIS